MSAEIVEMLHKQHAMLSAFKSSQKTAVEAEDASATFGGWRRVSELVKKGYIAPVTKGGKAVTRPTWSGRPAQVYKITDDGRKILKAWNQEAKAV